MRILLKDQIENYRFTVAKIVFLLTEGNYELIQDFEDSNSMLVFDKAKEERLHVSILSKSTKEYSKEYRNLVFYQKRSYSRYKGKTKSEKNSIEVFQLTQEFEDLFNEAIREAFLDIVAFFERIPEKFHYVFEYYFSLAEKTILENSKFFYKYISKATADSNNHNVNDGDLAFSHPKYFNDPFDSNCALANNIDMRERFRVLCLTKNPVNILMWSYYSENHQGFCYEYSCKDIVNEIENQEYSGLYLYGDIKYSQKRPAPKSSLYDFSFTDLNFYIEAVFTKYEEWKHEKESRFVAVSDYHCTDFLTISPNINQSYKGCEGTGTDPTNSKGQILKTKKAVKDIVDYKLII
ncbi:DUF2971 domain-containing protein [Erysipelothrix rhusiopathiae]|nr:DUF2971 domain-containing protein [Erysipelothrix rhusiopathiae]